MKLDKRGWRISNCKYLLARELRRSFHTDRCSRNASFLSFSRNIRIRHEAINLSAKCRKLLLIYSCLRHICVSDYICTVYNKLPADGCRIFRKLKSPRIIEIRTRMNASSDYLILFFRQSYTHSRQLFPDYLEASLLDILRTHYLYSVFPSTIIHFSYHLNTLA